MGRAARIGVAVGAALVLALAFGVAFWAYHPDYQVLFSEVSSADAAAMTAELDRTKTPYQLADGGNTILVPKDLVYKTRLKLMGKDLPLHGAVGFEVFNNADFGMTDFVQKVNYQRAIQGELTRTILSIDDVQSARVHLAVPEQGMFKKAVVKSKASVTLVMKPGRALAPEQIAGIQRLVAASVPDVLASDVTVLDQHGIALTRVAPADGAMDSGLAQLDSRRSVEDYLLRKVTQVLDRTFGPGGAIASVDVSLNLDQSRVTTEDVLPAKNASGDGNPTGVVVRERQTVRDAGGAAAGGREGQGGNASVVESDYQVGRRIEHLVTAPGSTRRLTIAVVVRKPLTDAQAEKLKELIGLATGLDSHRGDAIAVVSMDRFATPVESVPGSQGAPSVSAETDAMTSTATAPTTASASTGALASAAASTSTSSSTSTPASTSATVSTSSSPMSPSTRQPSTKSQPTNTFAIASASDSKPVASWGIKPNNLSTAVIVTSVAVMGLLALLVITIGGPRFSRWLRSLIFTRKLGPQARPGRRLTAAERERMLAEVRQWIAQANHAAVPQGTPK
jgi:flagellar M-ring protein FliF